MTDHPILFKGEMVRAILAGRKTQTRRVINKQPKPVGSFVTNTPGEPGEAFITWCDLTDIERLTTCHDIERHWFKSVCRYGHGDRLWVRESCYIAPHDFGRDADANRVDSQGRPRIVGYAASMDGDSKRCAEEFGVRKSPSIHMPRWASRLTLEITAVRVERVEDISENDAICEGMLFLGGIADNLNDAPWADPGDPKRYPWRLARSAFCAAWRRINGADSWLSNPWVWVIEFKRIEVIG